MQKRCVCACVCVCVHTSGKTQPTNVFVVSIESILCRNEEVAKLEAKIASLKEQ